MRTHQQRQKRARRLLFEPLEHRHLLAPIAADDSYFLTEDTALTIHIGEGVLKNDVSDYPLTARVIDGPARGVLAFGPGGSFIYAPSRDFHGLDSFTYQATDSITLSNIAAVTLTVQPVNDPPLAVNDSYLGPNNGPVEDVPFVVSAANGLLKNDLDPDGQPITVSLPSVSAVAGTGNNTNLGIVVVSSDGRFTYSPGADFFGTVSFTYRASDGIAESPNPATVTIAVQSVNDPPVAVRDLYTTNEDSSLVVSAPGILANDTDIEGDPLTAQLVSFPFRGTLNFNPFGGFTYIPNINFYREDSFTYRASDGIQFSTFLGTVSITVTNVNDAPIANNDGPYTVAEDAVLTVTGGPHQLLLANDSDPDNYAPTFPNAGLTASLVTQPLHGTVTVNQDGSFTYLPVANFFGADFFTYRAIDPAGFSSRATVTINVQPVNDAPFGVNDIYNVHRHSTLLIPAAIGVLRNDFDVDGDLLTAVDIVLPISNGTPANGTLTVNADGSFTYAAPASTTQVSFTYRASDGTFKSSPVTVWINVGGGPPPVAVNDSYPAIEDAVLTIAAPGVLLNDTDPSGIPLAAVQPTQPAHGTVVLNPSGGFTYTPNANFFGLDAFTYRVFDGEANSNPGTVTINAQAVNDPPVATNANAPPVLEDQTLTVNAPGLLLNVSDIDSPSLTILAVTQPSNGTITFQANGNYTYAPGVNFNGADSFTYTAVDGALISNTGTITINIQPVNDLPFAANDTYPIPGVPIVQEDTVLTVSAALGLLRNDTDADGDVLNVVLASVTQPSASSGSVAVQPNGSFIFTPALHFSGPASFTYVATDTLGNSNTATVTLNVADVDHIPIAHNDSGYSTNEDTALTTTISILANDINTDVPAALSAVLVSLPAHGTLNLNINGQFTYTPLANLHGVVSFTYRASDGVNLSNLATVTINVAPQPDPPLAVNDSYFAPNHLVLSITAALGVLVNDTDADGDSLTAIQFSQPSHGSLSTSSNGAFTYTPPANFIGVASFTYRATDGTLLSDAATVTIQVRFVQTFPPQNDTYSATEDQVLTVPASEGVLVNDRDLLTETLIAVQFTQPLHGVVSGNPDGSFTYTPFTNFFGMDIFTYRVTDGQLVTGPTTVTINVQGVNDPPAPTNDQYTTLSDFSLSIVAPGILANDIDPDGDVLVGFKVTDPAHGVLVLNSNGSFTYTPDRNFGGFDSFDYGVTDGQFLAIATVTVAVIPFEPHLIAVNDNYAASEDKTLQIPASVGVLANDVGPDSESTVAAILVSGPAHGSVALNLSGGFTYAPNPNFNGTDTFTYKINDGTHDSNVATVKITVQPVNDPPSATIGFNQSATDEDPPQTIFNWAIFLSAGPPDESGQSLTLTVTNDNSGLFKNQPAIDLTGTLTFAPKPNASGKATVTVTLKDDGGTANGGSDTSAPLTFAITVTKPYPLHNTARPLDTDDDTFIAPLDALLIINYLNSLRPGSPNPSPGSFYFDTSRDNDISPLDALLIINHLNALQDQTSAGEGESNPATLPRDSKEGQELVPDLFDLLAADTAPHKSRRRLP